LQANEEEKDQSIEAAQTPPKSLSSFPKSENSI